MVNSNQSSREQTNQRPHQPFDDIQDLYIGQIAKAKGSIQTDRDILPSNFWGEVLVYGHVENDTFVVERLRGMRLYGAPADRRPDDRIGVISLAGPLAESSTKPSRPGLIDNLHLQLHYADLSAKLDPRYKGDHAVVPQVERIAGRLTWKQEGRPDPLAVLLEVEYVASELVDRKLGVVKLVTLEPILLSFQLAGTGSPRPAPHNSLLSNCPTPTGNCGPATDTRTLSIRFVSFSGEYDLSVDKDREALEAICQAQIDGVCEVWRDKGALDLTVQTSIVPANQDQINAYRFLEPPLEPTLPSPTVPPSHAITGHIEVYLIDEFTAIGRHGGGITYDDGQASAFCILDLGFLELQPDPTITPAPNPYLLAHELGHILGLAHPDGTEGLIPSSWDSVMEAGIPNPNFNTLYNCRVFTAGASSDPLNPIVQTTTIPDCFRPDPVDHYIRDFPSDTGDEPSIPPAGENHWSNSNVWNRRSNTPGGTNATGGPEHEEPFYTDITNYMHVKLEYRTNLRDPVNVDLYLADPGVSPGSANLIPLDPMNNRLIFNPPTGSPEIQALSWSPVGMPPGYPTHCSVFAIAHSVDEPSPFDDPTTVTFGDVSPLLGTSNDIAQRNLHVQGVSPLGIHTSPSSSSASVTSFSGVPEGAMSFPSALPWLQMANPFDAAAAAHLEIDTTLASNLVSLSLEVDDRLLGEVNVGGPVTVNLAEALPPDEHMILRLKAGLLPDVPEGTTFPIDLRFFVNSRLLGGYQYVLRVAPLSETVVQVLDMLFGTMRDVAAAFESDAARDVAGTVREIVMREKGIEPRRGFWSLIQKVFSPKSGDWQTELSKLADRFAALAQSLEVTTGSEPERQVVCQHLYELAGRLLTSADTASPNLFIEQLRALADHIQEPAGRLARRLQRT